MAAYARVQPFGVARDDWHHAKTQAVISNGFQNLFYLNKLTRNRKSFTPSDFMLERKKTEAQRISQVTTYLNSRVTREQ